jgi:alpha-L-arabinofuranosidase
MYASRRDGVALHPAVQGPGYDSSSYGYVNYIDTSAILGDGELHVFLVNRSLDQSASVEINYAGDEISKLKSAELITGNSPQARNTFEQPDQITCQQFKAVTVHDTRAHLELPALSIAALTFGLG